MNVTACLITWKRPGNIPKIIEHLEKYDFINEIIVQDNNKGENLMSFGRYFSAKKAKNDVIYVQDDDCIINNLDQIYESFVQDPVSVTHSGIPEYEKVIPDNIYGPNQMSLMGWGAFFQKKDIPILDKYVEKYGEDFCFKRETDRIFTLLLQKHHSFVLGDITMLEGARNENALSSQTDHIHYKQLAIKRALELINYEN